MGFGRGPGRWEAETEAEEDEAGDGNELFGVLASGADEDNFRFLFADRLGTVISLRRVRPAAV